MTRVITVSPKDLPASLQSDIAALPKVVKRAVTRTTERLKAHLVNQSDELGITDRGAYKRGFRSIGDSVLNDCPYAGVIEEGARPHMMPPEAIESLAGWVRRKLTIKSGPVHEYQKDGVTKRKGPGRYKMGDDEAMKIARAIAYSIAQRGQEGRYVMYDALPFAVQFLGEEINRALAELSIGGTL